MSLTQSALVEAMQQENIPVHRHFLAGGAFHKKAIKDVDGAVVVEEIDKMICGDEDSAYYLAVQPLLNGVPRDDDDTMQEGHDFPEMHCCDEEFLLRAKDGTQNFPAAVTYHLPAAKRQEFSMWQTLKAVERAGNTGRCQQINWWEGDLQIMAAAVIDICAGKNVRIELTEFKKEVDAACFPALTAFTLNTIQLLATLHYGGVRVSLDDCNWIQQNHPCNFEFALAAAPFLDQVKLDIKACAQVYNSLPNAPFADRFAPLEPDEEIRAEKALALSSFVEELRRRNGSIHLVIELSVCTLALADMFPAFHVFSHEWVLVQGGRTNNWAMKV